MRLKFQIKKNTSYIYIYAPLVWCKPFLVLRHNVLNLPWGTAEPAATVRPEDVHTDNYLPMAAAAAPDFTSRNMEPLIFRPKLLAPLNEVSDFISRHQVAH